jgi:tetratricopeptide (TPR) repeat protein
MDTHHTVPIHRIAAVLVFSLLFPLRPIFGQAVLDPFEPTVPREESEFLTEVMTVAQTNAVAAVQMLRLERPEEAESPALDFALGNLHFQEEEWAEAEQAYRVALEKMPRFRAALMNLGRILLLQDRPQETIEVYQQLVSDGQADADILLLLGHALLMEDAVVGAETAYRQALLLRPKDSEIRIGLAKALLQQERYQEGLALIDGILANEPLNRELWSLRANAHLSNQEPEDAIRVIEQARRLNRASPEMLATLGDLWIQVDRPGDALEAYREAFAVEAPSMDRLLRAIEGFLLLDDITGADNLITKASTTLKLDPEPDKELRLLRLRAESAVRRENTEQAKLLLEQVLKANPLDGQALLTLSDLYVQEGRIEQALLTAERAARINAVEAEALLRQARIEVDRGNYARAIPLLETAQAFEPRDAVARYLQQVRRLAE